MTPIPLEQLGFGWRDHKSALWWLGLVYRRPKHFEYALEEATLWATMKAGLVLYAHCFPYLLSMTIALRAVIFACLPIHAANDRTAIFILKLFHLQWRFNHSGIRFHFSYLAAGIVFGIVAGIASGIVSSIAVSIGRGIADVIPRASDIARDIFHRINGLTRLVIAEGAVAGVGIGVATSIVVGIATGMSIGMARSIASGIVTFIAVGIAYGMVISVASFGIVAGIVLGIVFGIVIGITFGVGNGIIFNVVFGVVSGIAFIVAALRLYYLPLHWLLMWPQPRVQWARYHPVLWDDLCLVPFTGLHRLLTVQAETQRWRGRYAIERIIAHYTAQRIEALRAKIILLARRAGRLTDLTQLDTLLARLPEGDKGFLSQTGQLRAQVSEISRLQVVFNTITLPSFRTMQAEMLVKEIEHFRDRIAGYHEPLATEFRAAASQWLIIARCQLDETRQSSAKEATPQVFRAGDPVDSSAQEAFTPRYAVIENVRQQVMLNTGCPGIVLYGRRRMGKSTLLRNLTDFLPPEVLTVFVSLQNPNLFTSLGHFTHTLAAEAQTQARELKLNEPLPDDLPGLFRFLTTVNERLAAAQKRLLLAVDEYEAIDKKVGDGVFPHDLLDTLRESIQTHRRLTWIFAGSHEITELPHAAWTSALVSARTIEVPAFTLAETRLLLTEPLKHSSLWRGNEAKRPRFDAAFWGTEEGSGIDYIHAQAGGWPHLVQLIAETLVDLVNEEEAHAVTPALLQRALDKAIVRGHNVLYELLRRECTLPGEWEYLERFKKLDAQPAPEDEAIARSLRRRELMAIDGGEWRLRVPLMERWLRVRG